MGNVVPAISYWRSKARTNILSKVEESINKGTAKNIILFLGDGMSVTTLAAARIYMGQLNNQTGENSQLSFEKFPYSGFSKVRIMKMHLFFHFY